MFGNVYNVFVVVIKMEDCVFCRIVAGEIPCYKVWEDDKFVAFLDINPYCRGHVVVIPKGHFRWVWDVDDYGEYMDAVRKVVFILRKAFGTDYIQEAVVGEEVDHCHVHLFPRIEGDLLPAVLHEPMKEKVGNEEMKRILVRIKESVE